MRRVLVLMFVLLPLCGIVACQRIPPPGSAPWAAVPEFVEETPNAEPDAAFPTEACGAACAYVWSSQNNPEVADAVRKALLDAGMPDDIEVHASAFGENCLDPATGNVICFLTMQTDFSLVIPVESVDDTQALGEQIEAILAIFAQFPPGQVPGNPGTLQIRFSGKAAETGLSFSLKNAQGLLQQGGLRGSALYRALENP